MTSAYSSSVSTRLFTVLQSAAWLYGARIVDVLVRVVYVLVLARFLGSEDYGLFSYGQSFYLFLLLFGSFGLKVLLSQAASCSSSELSQMVKRTLALKLVIIVVLIIVFLISTWVMHDSYRVKSILAVLGLAMISRGIYLWTQEVFIVTGRSSVILLLNIFWRPVELGLVIYLLLGGTGLFSVAIIHSMVWCAEAIVALELVRRIPLPVKPEWNMRIIGRLYYRGIPYGLLVGATNYLMLGPLLLFPHLVSNPLGLGQLAVLIHAMFVFGSIGWSIGNAALPALSREHEFGEFTRRYADLVSRAGWLLGLVLTIFWMGFGSKLIQYLLGPDYVTAGDLMGLSMVALAPMVWGATLSYVLLARFRHVAALVCVLAGAGGMTVGAFLFIPAYGVLGGIISLLLGIGTWSMAIIVVLLRAGCLDVYKALVRPGCVTISVIACYGLLKESYPIISVCIAALILLIATLACGVVSKEERLWIFKRLSLKRLDEHRREV